MDSLDRNLGGYEEWLDRKTWGLPLHLHFCYPGSSSVTENKQMVLHSPLSCCRLPPFLSLIFQGSKQGTDSTGACPSGLAPVIDSHPLTVDGVTLPCGMFCSTHCMVICKVTRECQEKAMKVFCSSCWVMSNSLWPHGLQHTRLLCLPVSPGVCSNSYPLSSVMPSNHLILYHPLLLLSIFPSIRVFSNESALHINWPKYYSFSLSISPGMQVPGDKIVVAIEPRKLGSTALSRILT